MKALYICIMSILYSLMFNPAISSAQVVNVKGMGTITYSSRLSTDIKQQAYLKAQMQAVERYFAERGEAESQNFEINKDKIQSNIDNYILGTVLLDENDQQELKKYSVTVRVELNESKLRNVISASSSVAKTGNSNKSTLVFLFAARESGSVREFDTHIVQRTEVNNTGSSVRGSSTSGTEGESITDTKISTNASRSTVNKGSSKQSTTIESGGSATRKADQTTYRILPLSNQKTAITGIFSQAGFQVVDPEFALNANEIKAVNRDFTSGNDLLPATFKSVVGTLRGQGVPNLVLATIDAGLPSVDPSTGMKRVVVVISARVLDLTSGFPRETASVPPVQYAGLGVESIDATNKAVTEGSLIAAREVVSRLNAIGIR